MHQRAVVVTLTEPEFEFLKELVTRAVRNGMIEPDELPYGAAVWSRIKQAQVVDPMVTGESAGIEKDPKGGDNA